MKITVFWDVTLSSLVVCTYILKESAASNYRVEATKDPEDGGNRLLSNVGTNLPIYMAPHTTNQ
jgi:hypothetical protein